MSRNRKVISLMRERIFTPLSEVMPPIGSKGYFADSLEELDDIVEREDLDVLKNICGYPKQIKEYPFDGENQTVLKRYFYLMEEPDEKTGLEGSFLRAKKGASSFFFALDGFLKEAMEGDLLDGEDTNLKMMYFQYITRPLKDLEFEIEAVVNKAKKAR